MPLCGRGIGLPRNRSEQSRKGISQVQLSHVDPTPPAHFDDPSLVSAVGLVPTLTLAQRAGLIPLASEQLTVPGQTGYAAGVDSIEDMDPLPHGTHYRISTTTGTDANSTDP